jgi:23S rRNA (uracil1939-C5)-methyltransferase
MSKSGPVKIAHVDVERVAPTGEGIATLDGQTVFVRGALANEHVRIEVVHRGKIDRANVLTVVTASPERVEPPCDHVTRCGGCDLMHASMTLQREVRARGVQERLRGVSAELDAGQVKMEHHPTPTALGYRSRARLRIHGHGGSVQVGYYKARSQRLAPIDACVILRPELAPMIARLGEWLAGSEGSGEARIALGDEQLPVVVVSWSGRLAPEVFARFDEAVRDRSVAGVELWEGDAQKPAVFGTVRSRVVGVDGEALWIPPRGFAQASEEGGRLLAERVGKLASLCEGGLTIELFAGSGTLTVAARQFAERYIAVEQDGDAVAMLRQNLADRGMSVKAIEADAETYPLKRPVSTVILDPPRGGAPRAAANVAKARPKQVVYASCNPSTLARDLRTLSDYRITHLELIELFPQTSHVETLVRLERRG